MSDVTGIYSTIDHFIISNYNNFPRSGWKEHVAMYRTKAINWHAFWLSRGCPSEGYGFNIRKVTQST